MRKVLQGERVREKWRSGKEGRKGEIESRRCQKGNTRPLSPLTHEGEGKHLAVFQKSLPREHRDVE